MTQRVWLVLLLVLGCRMAVGQELQGSDASPARIVTERLDAIRAKHDVPSLVGVVVHEGRVVAQGAAGVRRLGGEERVTVDDRFHLGSCTKSMTATLCGMLVEEGKLRWDTPVGQVFAKVPMDDGWRKVTLEQLLTNRGGAPHGLDRDGLWGRLWRHTGTPTQQRLALVTGVLKHPPGGAPGETYVYSNAGFSIAGAMAESVTGEAWETLMRKRLFEPLGMQSAGFGAPGDPKAVDAPWGHHGQGDARKPMDPGTKAADNPVAIGPAGIVHCSLPDWAKYLAMHVDAGKSEGALLTAETFTKLHTPIEGGGHRYAMGWLVAPRGWAGGAALTHAGSNTMWYAVCWLAPARGFAVLVATNQAGAPAVKACDEAASALIREHLRAR